MTALVGFASEGYACLSHATRHVAGANRHYFHEYSVVSARNRVRGMGGSSALGGRRIDAVLQGTQVLGDRYNYNRNSYCFSSAPTALTSCFIFLFLVRRKFSLSREKKVKPWRRENCRACRYERTVPCLRRPDCACLLDGDSLCLFMELQLIADVHRYLCVLTVS